MAVEFDRDQHFAYMQGANDNLDKAAELGKLVAGRGIKQLYLIACGAANKQLSVAKYWVEQTSKELEVHLYYPAEFISQNPPRFDANAAVILASHSGTTPETVAAAEFLRDKPCITIGVTRSSDNPLAQAVDHTILYGESQRSSSVMCILFLALVGSLLKEREGWSGYDSLISSLEAVPAAMADAIEATESRVTAVARRLKDDTFIPVVASGPTFGTAYITGICLFMESLWLHSCAVEAAEFFHGPLEIVDQNLPLIVLLSEDPSRPIAERVVRFCHQYTERLFIFDSKDYAMPGVAEDVRPYVAPVVHLAVMRRLAEHLAVWRDNPLTTRRYYRKMEY